MSDTLLFVLAAGALLLAALLILLRPPWRGKAVTAPAADRREATLTILRDELRELERERDEGALGESDFAQARDELQRRLLEEITAETPATGADSVADFATNPATDSAADSATHPAAGRRTALVLLTAIPLAAIAAYALLGNPQALDPARARPGASPQEFDILLQRLSERLAANPDDLPGWVLLARSYKTLGRFAEAAEAFARAEPLFDGDPALLADYAETLALTHGGRFAGQPEALLARALENGPDEPRVLFVAGAAASARQDFAAVVDYWGRLLPRLDPDSDDARALAAAIDQARRKLSGADAGESSR